MRTCPACGRSYEDDVTVCPADGEPLGAVTVAGAAGEQDPETVVRPRQAKPLAPPRFTEIPLERPAPDPPVLPTGVPDRVYRERQSSPWPAVAVMAVIIAAAVAVLLYFMMSRQSDLATEVGAQITEARVAVADARARLESLPPDSPLRQRLVALQGWDRQLQAYELSGERTREMASRAREIAGQARAIGEEARVAGALVPTTPPVVEPAAPPAETPPATNAQPAPDASRPGEGTARPEGAEPGREPPPAPDTPETPPGAPRPKPAEVPGAPDTKGEREREKPPEVKPPAPASPEERPQQ